MTTQGKKSSKTRFHFRITDDNYDFLYAIAARGDISVAKALNRILAQAQSGTTICETTQERVMVNHDGRRGYSQRHGCA
jgi:hypothetical protein